MSSRTILDAKHSLVYLVHYTFVNNTDITVMDLNYSSSQGRRTTILVNGSKIDVSKNFAMFEKYNFTKIWKYEFFVMRYDILN